VKLNNPLGADLGPFNLTANVGSVSPSTALRDEMINGIVVTVDANATQITVTSNNSSNCSGTSLTLNITGLPIV
jgi:hypothetical protein